MKMPLLIAIAALYSNSLLAMNCFTLDNPVGKSDAICIDHHELDFHDSYALLMVSKYNTTGSVKINDQVYLRNLIGATDFSNARADAFINPFRSLPVVVQVSGNNFRLTFNGIVVTAQGSFNGINNVGGATSMNMENTGSGFLNLTNSTSNQTKNK